MRTIRNRFTSRGHGRRAYDDDRRDEFSNTGMEDGWRNEDYYFDRITDRRGYSNRDHAGGNYWPVSDDMREQHEGNDNRYVPSFDYGRERREGYNRAYGYGNEGSPSMREYRHWTERSEPEGYFGRNDNDYRHDYGDRDSYNYNPSDYDRGGYRRNYDSENQNRFAEGRYRERRDDGYSYGEYESYPNYSGDRSDSYRESDRFRNGDRGRGDRRRPNISEKRY